MLNKDSVKTITDLRTDPLKVFRAAEKAEEPFFIFNRAEPVGVILGWEEYGKIQERLEDLKDAAELKEARETSEELVEWKTMRKRLAK